MSDTGKEEVLSTPKEDAPKEINDAPPKESKAPAMKQESGTNPMGEHVEEVLMPEKS